MNGRSACGMSMKLAAYLMMVSGNRKQSGESCMASCPIYNQVIYPLNLLETDIKFTVLFTEILNIHAIFMYLN